MNVTTFSRYTLENFGKKLSKFTKNNTIQGQRLYNIDLDSLKNNINQGNKNAFHDQIPNLSRKLFNRTPIGKYSKFANQIIPKSTLEKFSDNVFLKLGNFSQKWAEFDLKKDPRFANQTLDASERHALAKAISDQNRALATMGGVSNLAGLTGILFDSIWLLAICLRSIFQIAHIYDKPLTGKEGIAIAFEILGKADLSKLQEKQTLLAGVGVVETMSEQGFHSYQNSTNIDNDSNHVHTFFQKIDEFATAINVNLHTFNLNFLNKILPITAVGIGSTYNNIIINEVVQLANATFAPTPKLMNIGENDEK